MTTFKVWVEVEQHNGEDANPEYEKCDLPFAGIVTFDTEEEAVKFATHLNDYGELLAAQWVEASTTRLYRDLAKGLYDIMLDGRLVEADIPDDFDWLKGSLAVIDAVDIGLGKDGA